ncbi:hypothetical protein L7F22_021699 [Adiantum nelumboides]|nr:hypothetical protein [Adiantum nelumboides]
MGRRHSHTRAGAASSSCRALPGKFQVITPSRLQRTSPPPPPPQKKKKNKTKSYLYVVEYNVDLSRELEIITKSKPEEERLQFKKKEHVRIDKKYSDKMGTIFSILDPRLGDVWKEKVFSLRWLEVFLEKIECAAIVTLGDLSSLCDLTSPMLLPHDYPLQAYMEEIKLEARNHMFVSMRTRDSKSEYKGTCKVESSQSKATEIDQAAQRVVYRYLFALVKEDKLKELPIQCLPWCDLESVNCMYQANMRDLSSWELANDPWWIDLKPRAILARARTF